MARGGSDVDRVEVGHRLGLLGRRALLVVVPGDSDGHREG
jgi:hypothetical protein